ncbi:MAG: FAD-dependent oxidoreductase [Hyphomicrobium sp.]|nr:FAD-dependent oxidoreductase [Hyphomicrobium sp.]
MSGPRQRLVLLGGGHTHALVLLAIRHARRTDVDVTLVAKEAQAPYSGMLPGFVAGHYPLQNCLIDLPSVCRRAGVRLVHASAVGIDRDRRRVAIEGGDSVPYDVLSIDIGITPDVDDIRGAETHALLVKPVSVFAPKWQSLEERLVRKGGPVRVAIVGGGAAGVELVLAMRHRLIRAVRDVGRDERGVSAVIVAADGVLAAHVPRAQHLAKAALARAGVDIVAGDPAIEVDAGSVRLNSGRRIAADAVVVSTRARAAPWLREAGLPIVDGGFLAVADTLQSLGDDRIFAAGDCATVVDHPRPKAGVFAVRQAPVLFRNLMRRIDGAELEPFVPQTDYLALISLGEKRAIATRGGWALEGRSAWFVKDWIDRRFMARFA